MRNSCLSPHLNSSSPNCKKFNRASDSKKYLCQQLGITTTHRPLLNTRMHLKVGMKVSLSRFLNSSGRHPRLWRMQVRCFWHLTKLISQSNTLWTLFRSRLSHLSAVLSSKWVRSINREMTKWSLQRRVYYRRNSKLLLLKISTNWSNWGHSCSSMEIHLNALKI